MSVVENPTMEQVQQNPRQQLAVGSAVGAVVLLLGLGIIFAGLPYAWGWAWHNVWELSLGQKSNEFLSEALLILVELIAIGAFAFFCYQQVQTRTQKGLRAGIVFAALGIFVALAIGDWLGIRLDTAQFRDQEALGWGIIIVVVAGLLAGLGYLYWKVPAWSAFLEGTEHQGWFHAVGYKGSQGVRVRRGTIVGILAVGMCGIIVAYQHHLFGAVDQVGGNDWYWLIPFKEQSLYVPLMFSLNVTMPIVLSIALVWLAWRMVNVPTFADFLIATEAEMNKVSWTTRRRLLQDTIVVLVTVFIFTVFLFAVDVMWIKILSADYVKVLIIDTRAEQQKQQEKAQW